MYAKSATDRTDIERSHRRRSRCTVSCGPYTSHGAPVRTLYTLFCLCEIPADSYSLERNKRYLLPSSLTSPLLLSLFLFLSVARKRIARAASGKLLPLGLLLHSALFARGRATGAFLFTRATSCSPRTLFFFLVSPSPCISPLALLPQLLSSFSPLFLLLYPGTRSRGIMQHITEKSKQARRNSPGSDRRIPLSFERRLAHPVASGPRNVGTRVLALFSSSFVKLPVIHLNLFPNNRIEELSPAQQATPSIISVPISSRTCSVINFGTAKLIGKIYLRGLLSQNSDKCLLRSLRRREG